MKNLRLVCVALVVAISAVVPLRATQESSPFTLVERVGEPHKQYFHLFTTPVGRYAIRNDGFVEMYGGGWKRNFHLKTEAKARVEWVYFYEYEGDLLLLYRTGRTGYLVRFDQKTRKIKGTHVVKRDFEPPVIRDKSAVFPDGTVVPL